MVQHCSALILLVYLASFGKKILLKIKNSLTKGCFLYTQHFAVVYFALHECFYFHLPCCAVFLSGFLNPKQIKYKKQKYMKFCPPTFFNSGIGK